MKNPARLFRGLGLISLLIVCGLVIGCNDDFSSKEGQIDIGSSVVLRDYAIVCKQPSKELNLITKSNGKELRDVTEEVSRQDECYDALTFEKGPWTVEARNDTRLLVKMQSHSGEYWVSSAHVTPGEPSALKSEKYFS